MMKSRTKRFVRSRSKRFIVVFAGALCVIGASAVAAVGISSAGDPDTYQYHWKATSSQTTFTSSVLNVTCTGNTAHGPDFGSGPDLGFIAMKAPTFTNCTDNLGGTDTVTVNQNGWSEAQFSDTTNAACPSGTGNDETTDADCIGVGVPQNSTTITSTAALACGGSITTTPSASEVVGASVTDNPGPTGLTPDTFTLTNQPVPFQCGVVTGTATFNGTYTLLFPDAGAIVDGS
jgi:hypothetical protein